MAELRITGPDKPTLRERVRRIFCQHRDTKSVSDTWGAAWVCLNCGASHAAFLERDG